MYDVAVATVKGRLADKLAAFGEAVESPSERMNAVLFTDVWIIRLSHPRTAGPDIVRGCRGDRRDAQCLARTLGRRFPGYGLIVYSGDTDELTTRGCDRQAKSNSLRASRRPP